ncbi:MAG: threonylcarbamoyl-AMP synthase [Lachnospiraceae bacterium]|jgi:L-threonylcarbamoyladenylate synthase|nr:threonylcarbamoyl-AMP synthase [Lachnospiraceae bacterium]
MKTKVVRIDENNIDMKVIEEAGRILKRGGLVAFPTETVYGLGGDALSGESSARIYAAKGRPSDNPLIIHIADMDDLCAIARNVPAGAYLLADRYWPGPLTMIFHKADIVPNATTGGLETVAVRMPSHKTARALIRAAGGFVAAPSANRSGRPSPTLAKYVIEDLDGRVDLIIDGGPAQIGLESTIVDFTEPEPVILRPGYITQDMIREVAGQVQTDRTVMEADSGQAPRAPGMKYRHYAPKGSLFLVQGAADQVCAYINEQTALKRRQGVRTGVIAAQETAERYTADVVKSMGKRHDGETAARELFRILREFDEENAEFIYAEFFEGQGVGEAVMNRLLKAAGHQIIQADTDKKQDQKGERT